MALLVMGLIGIALAVGLALLLYNFAHDTTGTFVRWGLLLRRGFFVVLGLSIALAFLFSGRTYLVFFGAMLVFFGLLTLLYDPTFKPLRGSM